MKIVLEAYNPEWKKKFQQEKQRIEKTVSGTSIRIEHIGSTSIEGLDAKPIIDILIGLKDFSTAQMCIEKLTSIGYQYINRYEDIMPDRRFFIKETEGIRTHHIHMVEMDTAFWKRHLAFRDYLSTHPAEKSAYSRMKYELAQKDWQDENAYADAKTAFIRRIEHLAQAGG